MMTDSPSLEIPLTQIQHPSIRDSDESIGVNPTFTTFFKHWAAHVACQRLQVRMNSMRC